MELNKYNIEEILNIEQLRQLFESFSNLFGFTTGLVEQSTNRVLIGTGWHDVCSKFHRVNSKSVFYCIESNKKLTADLNKPGQINISECSNGLIDGATPIIVNDIHMANLFTGQIFFEQPDLNRFYKQADMFDFDTGLYIEAVKKVPIVSEAKFRDVLCFLSKLSTAAIFAGLQRLQAKEKIKSLTKLLPICASCKKIRDDKGYWNQLESYIKEHSEFDFSHGICPECVKKLYPDCAKELYPESYKEP